MIRLLLLAATASAALPYTGDMLPMRTYQAPAGVCVGDITQPDLNGDGTDNDPVTYNETTCVDVVPYTAAACGAVNPGSEDQVICLWIVGGFCDGNGILTTGLAAGAATCVNVANETACNLVVAGGSDGDGAAQAAQDCVWTAVTPAFGCQTQSLGQQTGLALTALDIATPKVNAGVEFNSNYVIGVKAVPVGDTTKANLQGGVWFDSDTMFFGQEDFAGMANTEIVGSVVTAPQYGFWAKSTDAIVFNSWASVPPTDPADNTVAAEEAVAGWACQGAAKNEILSTGILDSKASLAIIKGNYITVQNYTGSTTCEATGGGTEVTAALGGLSYEKVAWDAGKTVTTQTSCTQIGVAGGTQSYAWTCVITDSTNAIAAIHYTPYSDTDCTTKTVATTDDMVFTQANPCALAGSDSRKIMNSAAEWDAICGHVHSGSMAAIQTQTTCVSDEAATAQSSTRQTYKMFPISTALDLNFTGQHTSADYMLYNLGLPFAAKAAAIATTGNAVYQMFEADSSGDVQLNSFHAMPPSQAFLPGTGTGYYVATGDDSPTAVAVAGEQWDDTVAGAGWQCHAAGAKISTGLSSGNTELAITASLKWITIRQAASCDAVATGIVFKPHGGTVSSVSYEMVVASPGSTPQTGCQQSGQTSSYSFGCSGADIVYTAYDTSADCTGAAESGTPVTFKTTATCSKVGASEYWWIMNSPTDWEAICPAPTPAPTPPPTDASGGGSTGGGTTTSSGAVAATGAAIAAGAAALIL